MQDSNTAEEKWHSYWLIVILALAASVRFYALDKYSLNAQELFSVSFCSVDGWLATAVQYADRTGIPALYPTLLCGFVDGFGSSDFAIRSFSAVIGVGIVYIVYLLGRDFFSAPTGILAAALVAINAPNILIDRAVSSYSLLAFLLLLQSYLFCHLLCGNGRKKSSINIHISQGEFGFQCRWSPNIPCNLHWLIGFWVSSAFAFEVNPVALIFWGAEAIAFLLLVDRSTRKALAIWLWTPLAMIALLWLPRVVGMWRWIQTGNFLGMPGVADEFFVKVLDIFSQDAVALKVELFLVCVCCFVVAVGIFKSTLGNKEKGFLVLSMCYAVVAGIALFFIKAVDQRSFLYVSCMVFVLSARGVTFFVEKMRPVFLKAAIAVFLGLIVLLLGASNNKSGVYQERGHAMFALIAKVIGSDQAFMEGRRWVVSNSDLFDFYLRENKVIKAGEVSAKVSEKGVQALVEEKAFYYVEYYDRKQGFNDDLLNEISRHFQKICSINNDFFRVSKFYFSDKESHFDEESCKNMFTNNTVSL